MIGLSIDGPGSLPWLAAACMGDAGKGGDCRWVKPPLYSPPACIRDVLLEVLLTMMMLSLLLGRSTAFSLFTGPA